MIKEIIYLSTFLLSFVAPIYILSKMKDFANDYEENNIVQLIMMLYCFGGVSILWLFNWIMLRYIIYNIPFIEKYLNYLTFINII